MAPCYVHPMTAAPLCFHPPNRAAKTAAKKKKLAAQLLTDAALTSRVREHAKSDGGLGTRSVRNDSAANFARQLTWQRCRWMGRSAVAKPSIRNMHDASGPSMLLGCNRRCAN